MVRKCPGIDDANQLRVYEALDRRTQDAQPGDTGTSTVRVEWHALPPPSGAGVALGAAVVSAFVLFTVPFFSTFFSGFLDSAFFSDAEATFLCLGAH